VVQRGRASSAGRDEGDGSTEPAHVPGGRRGGDAAVQGRIADTLFASKTTNAAWRSQPSYYAVSKHDRTTSPELQRFLAGRMKARTIEVDSSHLSIITHAKEIAALILLAAGRS